MIQFYTIAVIAILSAISPGPDFIVLSKFALSHSRRSAVMCALGIACGILVHTFYCVLGLAIIISKSILLFNLIKYLGAAYLIYLGTQALLSGKKKIVNNEHLNNHLQTKSALKAFNEGFAVNVLNPKCSLFMLSIFTLVISPNTSRLLQFGYGLEIALIALAWFCFLAFGLSIKPIKKRFSQFQQAISKITGAVLIMLGLKIAFEH